MNSFTQPPKQINYVTEGISSLDIYSQQLSAHKLLSEQEEKQLGLKINRSISALIEDIATTHEGLVQLREKLHEYLLSYQTRSGEATQRWQYATAPSVIENIIETLTDTLDVMLYLNDNTPEQKALRQNLSALVLTLTMGRHKILEITQLLPNLPPTSQQYLDQYIRLRAALIESNLRLVFSVAMKFRHSGSPLEDLIQEGNIGLIKAADRFNFGKGYRFSTYAFWCIQNVVKTSLQKNHYLISRPAYLQEKLSSIKYQRNKFLQANERFPNPRELAKLVDIPQHTLENILNFPADPLSMDHPLSNEDDAMTLEETLAQENDKSEQQVIGAQKHKLVQHLKLVLTARELLVIQLRFGIGYRSAHTLEEISHQLSISIERVRQLQKGAINKILALPESELSSIRDYLTLDN